MYNLSNLHLTHSQLLEGLKCESKQKTAKERRVGTRSLAHNILRGRGVCWSSKMGLRRVDKFHSLTWACIQPTQNGQCIVESPLVLGRTIGNTDTLDSPWPELEGSHHFPPYSILCDQPRSLHPNGFSLPRLPSGSFEIMPNGIPAILEPHNFAIKLWIVMRSKAQLQLLSRAFQRYVACPLQPNKLGRFQTFFGRKSNWQFDSRPFFWP